MGQLPPRGEAPNDASFSTYSIFQPARFGQRDTIVVCMLGSADVANYAIIARHPVKTTASFLSFPLVKEIIAPRVVN